MPVQPPNTVPVYLNSGGGMFGAIRAKLKATPYYQVVFGDRVFPGRAKQDTGLPYVVMSHLSCTFDDYMNLAYSSDPLPLETWKELIQVSVYADSYEAARQLAKLVNSVISRHVLVCDGMPCFLYPETRLILLEQNVSPRGGDVWHVDHRYSYWAFEWITRDTHPDECPPTVPFNTIMGGADDVGPPWNF